MGDIGTESQSHICRLVHRLFGTATVCQAFEALIPAIARGFPVETTFA